MWPVTTLTPWYWCAETAEPLPICMDRFGYVLCSNLHLKKMRNSMSKSNQNQSYIVCFNYVLLLQDMFRQLHPTSTSSLIPMPSRSEDTRGNSAMLHPDKPLHINTSLNPYNNDTISVTMLSDSSDDLVLGLKCGFKHAWDECFVFF